MPTGRPSSDGWRDCTTLRKPYLRLTASRTQQPPCHSIFAIDSDGMLSFLSTVKPWRCNLAEAIEVKLIPATILLIIISSAAAAQVTTKLSDLSWMAGCWVMKND